jgi:hypothetical protein
MKNALDESVELLGDGLREFPWHDPVAYANWCAQTYYYVRHSTRLLAVAAGRFGFDPAGDTLHHRFAAHMGEEKRHELLALNDLKAMKRGGLELYPELPSTRAMYESQYYKIEHVDPIALFGYILPLEVMSAKYGRIASEGALRAWGPRCATFLKVHVEEDVDHVEKAMAAVQGLSVERNELLARAFEQTAFSYCAVLRQTADAAKRISESRPAPSPVAVTA